MSLTIIKPGMLDTVQDGGRYGYQHQGINPGGAMDRFSAQLANALLGKNLEAPVIEMHFPAPQILFQKKTVICLAGAGFGPVINGEEIPICQPVAVGTNAVLSFKEKRSGARCYLAVLPQLQIEPWLHSYSTNLKAAAGGYKGRRLEKGDEIAFATMALVFKKEAVPLPWKYRAENDGTNQMEFIPGPEWDWLSTKAQTLFLNHTFRITPLSDRMGYRLQSEALAQEKNQQLISSAVTFGTVQLLPNGQLIVLMADHQTTGGYPRIANVISAHLPALAQRTPGEGLKFVMTNVAAAEEKWMAQQNLLQHLQNTCKLKLQNWLNAHRY
jgi:antagonist of KipI